MSGWPTCCRSSLTASAGSAAAEKPLLAGMAMLLAGKAVLMIDDEALQLELLHDEHRLGAIVDGELLEDRRYVGLHRGLDDIELIGDLLVELAFADEAQDLVLLRGQLAQAGEDLELAAVGGSGARRPGRAGYFGEIVLAPDQAAHRGD